MSPRRSPAPTTPPPVPPAPGRFLAPAAVAVSPVLPPLGLPDVAPPSSARGAVAVAAARGDTPTALPSPPRRAVAVAAERGDAPDPSMPRAGPSLPPRPSSSPPSALLPASAGAAAGPPATGAAVAPPRRVTAPAVAVVGPPDLAPLGATPDAPATGDPTSGTPSRAAPEHSPPPAETLRGPDGGSGNAAGEEDGAPAVGQRRGRDDGPAGRRVAAQTSGRDVAVERESRGHGEQDATVSAYYLTGAAHTDQAGPPRPGDLRGAVWAEWGYDPVVIWGQVTDALVGWALLEYSRASRQVKNSLAASPTWHAARLNQAVRAQLRKGGVPVVDPAYADP